MLGKIIKVLVVLIMLAALGGTGYYWHQTTLMAQTISGLEKDVEKGIRRQKLLQKKYVQEKAKTGTCMRAKMAEEGKNAKLLKQVQEKAEENEKLVAEKAVVEKKYQAQIAKFETKIERITKLKDQIADSREKVIDKFKASV